MSQEESKLRLPRLRPKRSYKQLAFQFDVVQKRPDYWSNVVGGFFEEATAKLAGGRRMVTDSSCDYCPDVVVFNPRRYLESKAAGRSNRIILYQRRLEREQTWAARHQAEIDYYLWRHRFYSKVCANEDEARKELARQTYEVIIIDRTTLHDIASAISPKTINRRGVEGYVKGWHLPIKTILLQPHTEETKNITLERRRLTITIKRIIAHDPF